MNLPCTVFPDLALDGSVLIWNKSYAHQIFKASIESEDSKVIFLIVCFWIPHLMKWIWISEVMLICRPWHRCLLILKDDVHCSLVHFKVFSTVSVVDENFSHPHIVHLFFIGKEYIAFKSLPWPLALYSTGALWTLWTCHGSLAWGILNIFLLIRLGSSMVFQLDENWHVFSFYAYNYAACIMRDVSVSKKGAAALLEVFTQDEWVQSYVLVLNQDEWKLF